MGIYLGQLGRMVELKCPAQQQVSTSDGYSFEETLEGRVKAQARPIQRRTWSLGTSDATTPAEQSTLLGFINGEWGPGPFAFVSADAPVTNLLSPAAAACLERSGHAGISAGGPVNLGASGWVGQSIVSSDPTGTATEMYFGIGFIPAIQGTSVTASAFIEGDQARVRIYWYGPDPVQGSSPILVTASAPIALADGLKRVSVTALPPAGATAFRVVGYRASRGTRPAATWTTEAFEWAAGEGCEKAVIHGASKSLVLASRDVRGGRYANLSYTITEVG